MATFAPDVSALLSLIRAHTAGWNPFDFLVVAIAVLVVPLLSLQAGRAFAKMARDQRNLVGRYWGVIARAVVTTAFVVFAWRWAGRPFAALGLDWPIGFRGQVGFAIVALVTVYYTRAFFRTVPEERLAVMRRRLESFRIVPATPAEFALFPFVAIFGSAPEELVYRGYLMWLFTPIAGVWGAALLSSFLFGLGHVYQGAAGILRTGLIGFAFAIGYVLTGSLWWLIVMHTMVNLYGGAFAWKVMRPSPAAA